MQDIAKIAADWWAAIAAGPLAVLGVKRLMNTYTKSDVDTLLDAKVDPLMNLITTNQNVLEKTNAHLHRNEILLTEVKTKLDARRGTDPQ